MVKLRPYQLRALESIKSEYSNGVRRQLIEMATGTGKTQVFSHLPQELKLGGKMLVLAHREELLDQAAEKIRAANPQLKVGVEQGKRRADEDCGVVVASTATLSRGLAVGKTGRIARFDWSQFDVIVIDEAHHSTADSYESILAFIGALNPDTQKLVVGFTATPERADGERLDRIYQKISYQYSIRQGINENWLVDIVGYKFRTDCNLDKVRTLAGDFNERELANEVNTPNRNAAAVKAWKQVADGRKTIGFCVDIQHSKDLAEEFKLQGIKAEAIWGNDSERQAKIARHKSGETLVLTNAQLLTEGYDDPSISCILMTRPTKSPVLYRQMAGRGTRKHEGKNHLVIVDMMDNTERHSLVNSCTMFGLPESMSTCGRSLSDVEREFKAVQEEFPDVDFTQLKDISQIRVFAQKAQLWQENLLPAELEGLTNFDWVRRSRGEYHVTLPQLEGKTKTTESGYMVDYRACISGWAHIKETATGCTMRASVNGKPYAGERPTLEEAIRATDALIRAYAGPGQVKIVDLTSEWRRKPASEKSYGWAVSLLESSGHEVPPTMTMGQASNIINRMGSRCAVA